MDGLSLSLINSIVTYIYYRGTYEPSRADDALARCSAKNLAYEYTVFESGPVKMLRNMPVCMANIKVFALCSGNIKNL